MDIRALEVFCRIVELKSFSKAAEAVYLTQPTVSGHIKGLEEYVGLKLLDRLGREVVPTQAGELLYGYARQVIALRNQAVQALEEYKGSLKGQLIIGGSNIPGEYVLPALLGRFKARYPDISITLRIADSREIARGVLEGTYELGAVGARFDNGQLVYLKLWEDELVLALPADHGWAAKPAVGLAELSGQPIILREVGSGSRKVLEDALRSAGMDVGALTVVAEIGSTEAIRQAVKSGAGISVISLRAIQEDLDRGTLSTVPLEGMRLTRDFYLVYHKNRSKSPLCEAFLTFLLQSVRPKPSVGS
ncbi:MAG: selenium metabolism-associated LysR family transcriptional regulator [candidate division NC10 bacterium]|jgi:DNA-binding transcriptional LysR family regulator|nr:LysR family transcriptional regulator [candidate division NC10 bacterium]MCZ6551401.1 selenium metabolism-associated LysR family transcriptional regulator [candidate division NC10 bacterium]